MLYVWSSWGLASSSLQLELPVTRQQSVLSDVFFREKPVTAKAAPTSEHVLVLVPRPPPATEVTYKNAQWQHQGKDEVALQTAEDKSS